MERKYIKPFWSWNDKLDKNELISQIEQMHNSGIGGFFMHARGGLETEYMSDEWFSCIKACMDKAENLGMEAWAYDENGWPSGFADGIVPSKCEDFCQKHLILKEFKAGEKIPENIIGCYIMQEEKFIRIEKPELNCFIISYKVNSYYVDTFNRDAIACFIENTHQKYYESFKNKFGKSLKGFFTDEPQYGKTSDIPWSKCFEAEFDSRYGYSVIENLPKLYFDVEDSKAFRFDFYSMVSDLFVSSFLKQIYDWCEEHNCKLTGHLMMEDGISSQIMATGGVMPCYEYFHEAGMDWLGKVISNSAVPKQLSSVAFQLGKKTVSEAFACVGWDISLNELKWIAQWHYVNGVTSLCPHLEGYSLRGNRKRDYPASLFVQLPWFKTAYKTFADYFTKLGSFLENGEDYAPILVIHPMHSGFIEYNPLNDRKIFEIDASLSKLARLLDSEHIPYHFGDEAIMKRHSSVKECKLLVGKCSYKAVLLPNLSGIDSNTANLLSDFIDNGGQVYYLGDFPKYIDGREDSRIAKLYRKCIKCDDICKALSDFSCASFETDGCQNPNIGYSQKTLPDGRNIYYIVNHSDKIQNFVMSVKKICGLYEYDIENDREKPLICNFDGVKTNTEISLPKYGSIIVKCGETVINVTKQKFEKLEISPIFNIAERVENSITLDCCEYKIDGGKWQDKTNILLIQQELLNLKKSCFVELKFEFIIDNITDIKNVKLCAETPQKCSFQLNGIDFEFSDCGYFVDKAVRKCNISSHLKVGINTLIIKREFYQNDNVYRVLFTPDIHETERNKLTFDTELESIYLSGDFSVNVKGKYLKRGEKSIFTSKEFSLSSPVKQVDISNLTVNGFWFFSGDIFLSQKISVRKQKGIRYTVEFSKLFAPAAEVYLNSQKAGLLGFAPFLIDVTDYLRDGENLLTLRLFSSNRNLLGPHHRTYGDGCFVNPSTFTNKPEWGEDPQNPTWTDNYSFVVFGAEI